MLSNGINKEASEAPCRSDAGLVGSEVEREEKKFCSEVMQRASEGKKRLGMGFLR